jgi:adenine phosphoribosyltransferase
MTPSVQGSNESSAVASGNAGEAARLKSLIRDIPDYPKPGILFKDITPLLADAEGFALATRLMAEPFADAGVTHVVAIESRGFILGAPVAQQLGAGFVPVRKPGKLPHTKRREEYALEYGTDALEMHEDAVERRRCLVVDDLLATGGTAEATAKLASSLGANIAGLGFVVELDFLKGREKLKDYDVMSLLRYDK